MMTRRWYHGWWDTLHEPRFVSAAVVTMYMACVIAGIGMVTGLLPTLLLWPLAGVEGVVLVVSGLIGIPAAWSGRWQWERAAVVGFTGVGVVLAFTTAMQALTPWAPHTTDTTASWLLGLTAWLVLGFTRWVRVHERPFAPGHGPVPIDVREREAARSLRIAEEARRRSERRGRLA